MKKIENVNYWRDPDLDGFEVCRVVASHHTFPDHVHNDIFAVGLMEKGGSYCLGPGRDDAFVAPGEIALINPGQVHSGVPRKDIPITYRMLYFDLSLMRNIAADILEKESALFDAVSCLLLLFGGLRRPDPDDGREPRIVKTAREFLSEDLDDKLSLKVVADAVGLSRYHLSRVFKKETGLPPHTYRTQRRIEAAKDFLKQGMPYAQVALETGFVDQSHFTNKFRQFIGATPHQYLANAPL